MLRTPIFACSDAELMQIAGARGKEQGTRDKEQDTRDKEHGEGLLASCPLPLESGSWWSRLQNIESPSPALRRAAELLQRWLALADKLPVHDLLDRIYFEGDVIARYTAVLPPEMRAKVVANLHAFMEIALAVDAGRYPSLPRFLQELRELRDSSDDAPDEGRLGTAGNAVRIYTVHESKGLEAPIVWLLDANAEKNNREGYDVLLDWPNDSQSPAHFSLYADQATRGRKRDAMFAQDAAQQAREEMNLLYVAMTRAQQALIVSGNSRGAEKERNKKTPSWYDRIAAAAPGRHNPLLRPAPVAGAEQGVGETAVALPAITPAGTRKVRDTPQQQRGIWLHALLQHLAPPSPALSRSPLPLAGEGVGERDVDRRVELQQRISIPSGEMDGLWRQAQQLLASPQLARFFDPRHYLGANNELPYVNARGETRRIDRLVEFGDEVWVLDYKLSESGDPAPYRAQLSEYRTAMQAVYAGKKVRCALLFAGGELIEL